MRYFLPCAWLPTLRYPPGVGGAAICTVMGRLPAAVMTTSCTPDRERALPVAEPAGCLRAEGSSVLGLWEMLSAHHSQPRPVLSSCRRPSARYTLSHGDTMPTRLHNNGICAGSSNAVRGNVRIARTVTLPTRPSSKCSGPCSCNCMVSTKGLLCSSEPAHPIGLTWQAPLRLQAARWLAISMSTTSRR